MDLVPILSLIILVATAVTLLLAVIAYGRYKWRERKREERGEQAEAVETVQRQEDAYVLAAPSVSADAYVQASQQQYADQQYAESQQYGQISYDQQYADQQQYAEPEYAEAAEPVYVDARAGQQRQAQAGAQAGGQGGGYATPRASAPRGQNASGQSMGGFAAPQPILPERRDDDFLEGAYDLDDYEVLPYEEPKANSGGFPEATIVPSQQGPGQMRPQMQPPPSFSEMTPHSGSPQGLRPPRTGVPPVPSQQHQQPDVSRSLFWEYDAQDGFMPVDGHHLSRGKEKPVPEAEKDSGGSDWL